MKNKARDFQQNTEHFKEYHDYKALDVINELQAPQSDKLRLAVYILLTCRIFYSRFGLTRNFGRATHAPARQVFGSGRDRGVSGR